jgi:hypothetical protein
MVLGIGTSAGRAFAGALLGPTLWLAWATFRRNRYAWWMSVLLFSLDAVLDVVALGYCGLVFIGGDLPGTDMLYPRVCRGTSSRFAFSATALFYLLRPSVQRAFGRPIAASSAQGDASQ